jgi:hypothetical protein
VSGVGRGLGLLLVAFVAATALVLAPSGADTALGASTKLTLLTDSRYDVQPGRHRVHVTVDITATNHTSETRIRRYFFDHANLAVLPGTTGFKITSSGVHPSVRVASRPKGYTLLSIGFGRKLYSGRSMTLRLTFDLNDSGAGPASAVRITDSLATFPVWAYASDGVSGSTVRVVFPPGYSIEEANGTMGKAQSGPNGTQVFSSGPVASPLRFSAYFIADRPGAFSDTPLNLTVAGQPLQVVVRPWADDPAWGKRMVGLVRAALPALGDAIGLPYEGSGPLVVEEAIGRTKGAPIGQFDPAAARVRVAYYADSSTALREIALAWFNGGMLADRWADEAFASYYAESAARTLKIKVTPAVMTPAVARAKLPLNSWQPAGRADDPPTTFANVAGLTLARAVAARAGAQGLQAVWRAAAAGEAAEQPVIGSEQAEVSTEGPPDWRGLLDLLETRTGKGYDDLWRTWVVTPEQAALLDRRAEARDLYDRTIEAAGDWRLPASVRRALDNWQFDQATVILVQTTDVLEMLEPLRLSAEATGVSLPPTVKELFERTGSPAMAGAEVDAERRAISELAQAKDARPATVDVPVWLGLLDAQPDALIARAGDAFSRGDLPAAVQSAQDAKAIWEVAPDTGRRRFVALILSALIVLAIALLTVRSRAGDRRRRISRKQNAEGRRS